MFAGNSSYHLENSFISEFVFSHPVRSSMLHLKSGDQRSISPLLLRTKLHYRSPRVFFVRLRPLRARGHGRVAYPLPLSVGPGGGGVAGLVGRRCRRRRRSFGSPISQTGQTDTGMGKKPEKTRLAAR